MSVRQTSRNPQVQAVYDAHRAQLKERYGDAPPCPFCYDLDSRNIIKKSGTMLLLQNDFPYDYYNGRAVTEHQLLLPRRHIATMKEFTPEEVADYWRILSDASLHGYGSMTASAHDDERTVPHHLHTHLFLFSPE